MEAAAVFLGVLIFFAAVGSAFSVTRWMLEQIHEFEEVRAKWAAKSPEEKRRDSEPRYYWILSKEGKGPEIARLEGEMFWTTQMSGYGRVVPNDPEHVTILAGPIPEPK